MPSRSPEVDHRRARPPAARRAFTLIGTADDVEARVRAAVNAGADSFYLRHFRSYVLPEDLIDTFGSTVMEDFIDGPDRALSAPVVGWPVAVLALHPAPVAPLAERPVGRRARGVGALVVADAAPLGHVGSVRRPRRRRRGPCHLRWPGAPRPPTGSGPRSA